MDDKKIFFHATMFSISNFLKHQWNFDFYWAEFKSVWLLLDTTCEFILNLFKNID